MGRHCKKCGENLLNYVKIEGIRKNISKRVFCLKCSPFGQHNTRDLAKPTVLVNGKIRTKSGQWQIKSRRRKKLRAVNYLGGRCVLCGYDKCLGALEFHHLDGKGEKNVDPTKAIHQWSWERVKDEIGKCILVCSNCHREVHYGMHVVEDITKNYRLYGVNCLTCGKDFETRDESQIYCSDKCFKKASRKIERPSKGDLKKDMTEISNWVAIAKKYGVSDNTIRKWARAYRIETNLKTKYSQARKVKSIAIDGSERYFDTMGDASRAVGVTLASIIAVCQGKRKTAAGFGWQYI